MTIACPAVFFATGLASPYSENNFRSYAYDHWGAVERFQRT